MVDTTHDSRILRADTGCERPVGRLGIAIDRLSVWSLDNQLKMAPDHVSGKVVSELRDVVQIKTAAGRVLNLAGDERVRTLGGWRSSRQLLPGTRIAAPRFVPEPTEPDLMLDDEIILLAHMIGDGSCVKRQPIRYASIDFENLWAVSDAASSLFGVKAVRDEYAAARVTTLRLPAPYRLARGRRNPIAKWLDEFGLFGLRSYEKFVPARVFGLANGQVASFLKHLWATDGSVRWDDKAGKGAIYYATTSRRLADDVAQLLLRFGVYARIKCTTKSGYRPCWHVIINGRAHQWAFLTGVGVFGDRGRKVLEVRGKLDGIKPNTNLDTIPQEVWTGVKLALAEKGMSHREFAAAMGTQFCGSAMWKHSPSRARLGRAATIVGDQSLERLSVSDVYWDRIVSIEHDGPRTYVGIRIDKAANVVMNGIFVSLAGVAPGSLTASGATPLTHSVE